MALMYSLGTLAVLLSIAFIAIRITKGGTLAVYVKTLASVAFVALGLFGAYLNGLSLFSVFVLLGLIFGLLGDIVLDLKIVYKEHNNSHLNAGMLCFGVGHIMYFVALTWYMANTYILSSRIASIILIATGASMLLTVLIIAVASPMLKLDFGKFKVQTILYTMVLSFMTVYSITAGIFVNKLLIMGIGLLLIFISDLVLSNQYFGNKQDSKLFTILNHAIYYLGQITIAVMLYFI